MQVSALIENVALIAALVAFTPAPQLAQLAGDPSSRHRAGMGLFYEKTSGSRRFDLVIVVEAHYMRSPETANDHTRQVPAAPAEHLALLSHSPGR
jgi:hypothetical protein